MRPDLNKKIEEIINAADGIMRADAPPFLLTRINAALQNQQNVNASVWNRIASLLRKPAIAFAVLACILFFNYWVIKQTNDLTDRESVASAAIGSRDEMAVNATASYDIENQLP